jgi:uncharacterized protein (DUF362 family)
VGEQTKSTAEKEMATRQSRLRAKKKLSSKAGHASAAAAKTQKKPSPVKKLKGSKTASKPKKGQPKKRSAGVSAAQRRARTQPQTTLQNGGPAPDFKRATKVRAVIAQDQNIDKFSLLASALTKIGFWDEIERSRSVTGKAAGDFQVLIKPDFGFLIEDAPTGTDPQLVEHLIELLHKHGFRSVAIGEGPNTFDLWLENREVPVLADMIGYRFRTAQGQDYEVIDLSENLVDVSFPPGSALYGTELARPWVEADYRICFAKNKTDEEFFYALGLYNLLGVLPLRDKDYHYRHRLRPADVAVDLLKQTPVHFTLIDGFVSNHGSAGWRVPRPLQTHTIIASTDLLLADWLGAAKMGLDPYVSPLNAAALAAIGLPVAYETLGDASPYADWINVHPLIADSVRRRNKWFGPSSAVKPWLHAVDEQLFPFKDIANERVNRATSKFFGEIDHNPALFWIMVSLNYWMGAVGQGIEAFNTLYRKDSLRWIEAPLNVERSEFPASAYEAIPEYLEPLAALLDSVPERDGLRWRYLDGSVLFKFSRTIPAPFEEFIARVDITRAIEFMNDYIGGVAVPISKDQTGRTVHQLERNLYLTQPNYLVLYDGKVIDVTKLEFISYTDDEQKIFWKTIFSENKSADFDDGSVAFSRTPANETLVTVFGRQQFTLPLFWQVINLDYNPLLKDFLVAQAYSTFFSHTLANFEAKYEGREIRIGRPWNRFENEPGEEAGKSSTERLSDVVEKLNAIGENLKRHWTRVSDGTTRSSRVVVKEIDEEGFAHFPGAAARATKEGRSTLEDQPSIGATIRKTGQEARSILKELGEALRKDWGVYRDDK